MRVSSHRVIAGCGLLAVLLLFAACGDGREAASGEQAGAAGEVVVSLLPAVQGGVDADAVAGVVAAIRHRLERVGFEGVSVSALPKDELLVSFSSSPSAGNARAILNKSFESCGVLELRRMHPDSEILVANLKRLVQAGANWWVAQGEDGTRCVVEEEILLRNEHVVAVRAVPAAGGGGVDVVVTVDAQAARLIADLKARMALQPLALLLDGKAVAAPVSARSLAADTIVVAKGVSEARARELIFVLEAPLVVPLQTKG